MRVEVHKKFLTPSDPNFTENQNEGTSYDYPLTTFFKLQDFLIHVTVIVRS